MRAASTTCTQSEKVVEAFNSFCCRLDQRLQVVEREHDNAKRTEQALQDQVAFLSLLHAHVSIFCRKICLKLAFIFDSWEELALQLASEQALKARSPAAHIPVTQDLVATLEQIGFTWSDWQSIDVLAHASNRYFHGFPKGCEDTIKAIDSGSILDDINVCQENVAIQSGKHTAPEKDLNDGHLGCC